METWSSLPSMKIPFAHLSTLENAGLSGPSHCCSPCLKRSSPWLSKACSLYSPPSRLYSNIASSKRSTLGNPPESQPPSPPCFFYFALITALYPVALRNPSNISQIKPLQLRTFQSLSITQRKFCSSGLPGPSCYSSDRTGLLLPQGLCTHVLCQCRHHTPGSLPNFT